MITKQEMEAALNVLHSFEEEEKAKQGNGHGHAAGGLDEWNAALDIDPPPPRGWLLGNVFCRSFLSSLFGAGGEGKTTLRYAQALSLAIGRSLTGEHVFQGARVLIVSLEDDANELRRRILAARLQYNIPLSELDGWLFLAAPGGKAGKLMSTNKYGQMSQGQFAAHLEAAIVAHGLDLVIIDPFVKSHDIEENHNTAIDNVAQVLSDLAAKHNVAVDAPHHISKGIAEPGNANRGRGASAHTNALRLVYTLTTMSQEEAGSFNIPEQERRLYFRVDRAKLNLAKMTGPAQWFRLVGVPLGNATELYPNGDEVQTVEPWSPPDTWAGLSSEVLNRVLSEIERGMLDKDGQPTGRRYSSAPSAKGERQAWKAVQRLCLDRSEDQCREIIRTWEGNGLLVTRDYEDPTQRRTEGGLFVDNAKRPGTAQ
jgi:hypothetical protein